MKSTLSINGMTCASCAKAVERNVFKVDGVHSANVNLATEKLFIEFDDSLTDLYQIRAAVEKAGYEVREEADQAFREITLPISGMTCASCSNAVQRVIGKLDGVQEVSVNLATEKARVIYDSSQTRISEIKNAVAKAGYQALDVETQDQEDQNLQRRERQAQTLWRKFIVAVIFTIPLLYIAINMVGLPTLNITQRIP